MQAGESVAMGGVGQPGVRPVLQGGDTFGPVVQARVLGTVIYDDAVNGRLPCVCFESDHW